MLDHKEFSEKTTSFWLNTRVGLTVQTRFRDSWLAARLRDLGAGIGRTARLPPVSADLSRPVAEIDRPGTPDLPGPLLGTADGAARLASAVIVKACDVFASA